jgi:hypothetical protein
MGRRSAALLGAQSMIAKSGNRLLEKIMPKEGS